MANNLFAAVGLTGGTAGKLDDIHHDNISGGDIAVVVSSSGDTIYIYTYDTGAQAADSSPDKIVPDSNATGNGFWQLCAIQSTTNSDLRTFLAAANLSGALTGLGLAYDEIFIPAKAWTPHSTNGCAPIADTEFTTSDDVMISYLAFDGATEEYAGFNWVFPPSWDRSTIKAKFYWMPQTGCSQGDTVEWQLQGISVSNDDNLDTTEFTDTGEVISDTVLAGKEDDMHISGATPAITINGSPALGDMVNLKVSRNVSGTDDMTEDAFLIGVLLQFGVSNKVSAW